VRALGARQKQFAYRYLVSGPLRPAAAVGWRAALFLETRIAFVLGGPPSTADLSDVTAVIKTFQRPRRCAGLIASIRKYHPKLRIIVVDDSEEPGNYPEAEVVRLPFDSGVGAGRKAGLEHVRTKFVLNLDDDFLFYRGTRLADAVQVLRHHDELDLLGGQVVDLPLVITHDFRNANLHPHSRKSKVAPGTRIGPVEVMDKVANFFVARTDAVRLIGWDPALKRLDHADFFTRAKGTLVSGLWERFRVLHLRDPFASLYLAHRQNLAWDYAVLSARYPEVGTQ
jgi:glycosyltransferase involved in cell wall biosynthesis